jgi:hypothetical protein
MSAFARATGALMNLVKPGFYKKQWNTVLECTRKDLNNNSARPFAVFIFSVLAMNQVVHYVGHRTFGLSAKCAVDF